MRKRISQLEQKKQIAMNEVAATKEVGEETIEEEKFETNSTRFVHAGMLLALALGTGVIDPNF